MKITRIIPLLIIGITITLAAEDTDYSGCKTFLDVITAPITQHKHTSATLAKWKAWGKAHPKWKFHPSHLEIASLRFECPEPKIAPNPDAILVPPSAIQGSIDLDWTPSDLMIQPEEPILSTESDYQASTTGYGIPYSTFGGGFPSIPTSQPLVPTPEPESLFLLGTGLIAIVGVGRIYK